MDDSRNSVTSDERGELALIRAQHPAPHLTHLPGREDPSARPGTPTAPPRRPHRFPALASAALGCVLALTALATPALAQAPAAVSDVVVVPVPRTPTSLTVSWSAPDNAGKPAGPVPTLSAATVDGSTLTLTYDEALDEAYAPAEEAYTVTVGGAAVTVAGVAVEDSAVTLTLAAAVYAGKAVTVSYAVPATNPVQDADGTAAGALTNRTVTNRSASVSGPLLSPDGQIAVTVELRNGVLHYAVTRNDFTILDWSALGVTFTDGGTGSVGLLSVTGASTRESNTTWTAIWGKSSEVPDHFRELEVDLRETLAPQRRLAVIFRAYSEGIAFRYSLPAQSSLSSGDNLSESTEFNFAGDWPAYTYRPEEGPADAQLLSTITSPTVPLVLLPNADLRVALLEAAILEYEAMDLEPGPGGTPSLRVEDPDPAVSFTTPFKTPWRVLQIAPDFNGLLESRLLETLSPPSRIDDPSFVQPGSALWDRRIRKLVYGGHRYWFDTATYTRMIDFAAENDIPYVLIGSTWYGDQRSIASDPLTAVAGIDIAQVLEHARDNGVKILLYVNDKAFFLHDINTVFETIAVPQTSA